MRKVTVAVIGAGSAGLNAYRTARQQVDSVLLIDPGPLGTTCARVGCMPSKLLIAAADLAWEIGHAETFGLSAGPLQVDGPRVMQRVRSLRDRFVGKVLQGMESIPQEDLLKQPVRFAADHLLETADGEQIQAERIIIATGSRPAVPAMFQAAGDRLLVNDDLFELETLPESVVVFGPGVIGLELGQALHRLGTRTRLFGVGGALGPIGDGQVREAALNCFAAEFPLDPDARVDEIRRTDSGVEVRFRDANGESLSETFDYLLAATGRRPNVDQLGLENTGLTLDERGVPRFDPLTLQCSLEHIFIAGDANNDRPLLHEAADEGRIAGLNAARWPRVEQGHRTVPLAVVFSDPQIATLGMRPGEIEQRDPDTWVAASLDFASQARARVMARDRGLMKVWAEKGSGRLLGAELLGPQVEHLAHLLAWAMEQQLSVQQLLGMPYYHPVLEEGLRSLFRELQARL